MNAAVISLNPPRLSVVTAAAVLPVSVADAKLWLKVDHAADDALIEELIKAARGVFEEMTGRTLTDTTYRVEWDHLPRLGTYLAAPLSTVLELPRAPLAASSPIAWLKYLDADGAEQTISTADYAVETGRATTLYPRLQLKPTAAWPTLGAFPGALRCQFTAGYGAAATAVPPEILTALKLLVTHLYQKRDPVNVGNIVNELPWSLQHLVEMHRIRSLA